jgi:hypothetical protein
MHFWLFAELFSAIYRCKAKFSPFFAFTEAFGCAVSFFSQTFIS